MLLWQTELVVDMQEKLIAASERVLATRRASAAVTHKGWPQWAGLRLIMTSLAIGDRLELARHCLS